MIELVLETTDYVPYLEHYVIAPARRCDSEGRPIYSILKPVNRSCGNCPDGDICCFRNFKVDPQV